MDSPESSGAEAPAVAHDQCADGSLLYSVLYSPEHGGGLCGFGAGEAQAGGRGGACGGGLRG